MLALNLAPPPRRVASALTPTRSLSGRIAATIFATEEEERQPATIAKQLSSKFGEEAHLAPRHLEWHARFFERNERWKQLQKQARNV